MLFTAVGAVVRRTVSLCEVCGVVAVPFARLCLTSYQLCLLHRVSSGSKVEVDGEKATGVPQAKQPHSCIDQQPITEEEEEDASAGEREGGDSIGETEEEITRDGGDSNARCRVRSSDHSFKPPSGAGAASSMDGKVGAVAENGETEWRELPCLYWCMRASAI